MASKVELLIGEAIRQTKEKGGLKERGYILTFEQTILNPAQIQSIWTHNILPEPSKGFQPIPKTHNQVPPLPNFEELNRNVVDCLEHAFKNETQFKDVVCIIVRCFCGQTNQQVILHCVEADRSFKNHIILSRTIS